MTTFTRSLLALTLCVLGSSLAQAQNAVLQPDGNYKPAPGYIWLSADTTDHRTIWSPGSRHPLYFNTMAAAQEGKWIPAPGYNWVNNIDGDLRVYWAPGKRHSQHPNVFADNRPDMWVPAAGFTWLTNNPADLRVVQVNAPLVPVQQQAPGGFVTDVPPGN